MRRGFASPPRDLPDVDTCCGSCLATSSQREIRRSGSLYGSPRTIAAFTTLKTAVFIPSPSARVAIKIEVITGVFRNRRNAYRMSCPRRSRELHSHISRTSSLMNVVLPKARPAAYRASSGVRPLSCCSAASSSRSARSSRSRSSSRPLLRHQRMSLRYSYLSATIGLTRAARHAGAQIATSATRSSTNETPNQIRGSVARTP